MKIKHLVSVCNHGHPGQLSLAIPSWVDAVSLQGLPYHPKGGDVLRLGSEGGFACGYSR